MGSRGQRPAPPSTRHATTACSRGGRKPSCSIICAVPAMPGPPNHPNSFSTLCAVRVNPKTTRRIKSPRSMIYLDIGLPHSMRSDPIIRSSREPSFQADRSIHVTCFGYRISPLFTICLHAHHHQRGAPLRLPAAPESDKEPHRQCLEHLRYAQSETAI